ncbi:MAG TPA: hypothetical protein VFC15_02510, partial [Candidatus Limnocylindrales bacterium]|nr:hypothetical protein [Candidatus Limnocylindrales bacterium]
PGRMGRLPGFLRLGSTGGLAAGFSNIREALVVKAWCEDRSDSLRYHLAGGRRLIRNKFSGSRNSAGVENGFIGGAKA